MTVVLTSVWGAKVMIFLRICYGCQRKSIEKGRRGSGEATKMTVVLTSVWGAKVLIFLRILYGFQRKSIKKAATARGRRRK